MPAERFYIDTPIAPDQTLTLEGEEAHHLIRVMRARTGDRIEVVNGRGVLAEAIVKDPHKKCVDIKIDQILKIENPPLPVILAQALPKLNRIDTIVEKGTELGMTEIWFFPGDLSEKKELSPTQEVRFKNIAISAMKQCGCLYLPKIEYKPALDKWKDLPLQLYFGDTDPSAPSFYKILQENLPDKGLLFVVGPEKGLSPKENQVLKRLKGKGVSLHPNILRTDTAGLCALSQIYPFLNTKI